MDVVQWTCTVNDDMDKAIGAFSCGVSIPTLSCGWFVDNAYPPHKTLKDSLADMIIGFSSPTSSL